MKDENGNPVISSEKPPAQIEDFELIGAAVAAEESDPPPAGQVDNGDAGASYDDFPPLTPEKIKQAARRRWPRNRPAQEVID